MLVWSEQGMRVIAGAGKTEPGQVEEWNSVQHRLMWVTAGYLSGGRGRQLTLKCGFRGRLELGSGIWVLSNFLFTPPPHHWSIPGEGGGAGWEEWRHATPWGHSWTRGGSQPNAPGDARAGAPGSTL